jgi:hypothetical protein
MPRTAGNKSVRITITTTEGVAKALHDLLPTGLYGSSTAEVAERLICERLRDEKKITRQRIMNPKPE